MLRVYFIQESGQAGQRWRGRVKIGQTKNDPLRRMARLQTGNPRKLILRASFEDDSGAAESRLHEHFAHLQTGRLGGDEWFRWTDEVEALIVAAQKGANVMRLAVEQRRRRRAALTDLCPRCGLRRPVKELVYDCGVTLRGCVDDWYPDDDEWLASLHAERMAPEQPPAA